jgi:ABC-type nitrate/sulfonate/bicarbonate transport system ATPase subunit
MAAGGGPLINKVERIKSMESSRGILRIRNLTKEFKVDGNPMVALENINLRIEPGEFVCLVGPTGCGKSTLLRTIVGLEQDFDGNITLDDQPVIGTSLGRGIVFQDHRLFPWLTVEDNVGIALTSSRLDRAVKRQLVAEHLALVGLNGFARAYPGQLSGGMAQRAAIARGLVNRPDMLMLDEPFGALDALTRARMQGELQRIWQQEGITMILVTHDVEEAVFLGDRVVVMAPRPGRIREVININLPRPRERASIEFTRAKARILASLGETQEPRSSEVNLSRNSRDSLNEVDHLS